MSGYSDNYLIQVVKGIRQDLIHDFEKNRINLAHNGLKGSASETSVMEKFFSERYPFLEVGAGEIITSKGYRSGQIDIILYDRKTPSFFRNGKNIQVVPIEGVLGTVEVKTKLTGSDLRKAIHKSSELKRQGKSAFWNRDKKIIYNFYGESFDYFPIQTVLIALESIGIETITNILVEEYTKLDQKDRLNYIFVLNSGLIYIDHIENKIRLITDPDAAMFIFYTHTYSLFSLAQIPHTRIHDYGGDFNFDNLVLNI